MTTRICPVGSIGLQKLWPEIVSKREMGEGGERMRDRQTDRKRERERGEGDIRERRKSVRENVELTTLYFLTPAVMAVRRLARLFPPCTRSPFPPCPLLLENRRSFSA